MSSGRKQQGATRRTIGGFVAATMVATAVFVAAPIAVPIASAAIVTLTVTETNLHEGETPIGTCTDGPATPCSLQGAIIDATPILAGGDDVVIEFAPILGGQVFQEGSGAGTSNPAHYYTLAGIPAGRTLTIQGSTVVAQRPIFDGVGQNRLFAFAGAGTVVMRNVVIRNGFTDLDLPTGINGAGIATDTALVLDNVTMTGNDGDGGGGAVYATNDVTVLNSTISDSTATGNGGAISITGAGSELVVDHSTISSSSAIGVGGGVYCSCQSVTVRNDSLFDTDHGRNGGGAIYADGAAVDINFTSITNNTTFVGDGAGVYVGAGSSINVVNSIMSGNNAGAGTGNGGAISCDCDLVYVEGSVLTSNRASLQGGAISSLTPTSVVRVVNTDLSLNQAGIQGGAINCLCLSLMTSGSRFNSNTSSLAGGAIFATAEVDIGSTTFTANSATFGGGLNCTRCVSLNIDRASFADNVAGGGLGSLGGGAYVDMQGGATIVNTTFSSNAAGEGGEALYVLASVPLAASVAINHVTIANQRGEGLPHGAFSVDVLTPVALTVRDSIIADNEVNCSRVDTTTVNPVESPVAGFMFNGLDQPNIIEGGGCPYTQSTVLTADPGLQPLALLGGPPPAAYDAPVPVLPFDGTSIANNLTSCTGTLVDARGMHRVGSACDAGAFELGLIVVADNGVPEQIQTPASVVPLSAIPNRALTPPIGNGSADSQALTAAQVRGIDIESTPLRNIPLRNIGLTSIELSKDVLDSISLSQIPLDYPGGGGWTAYLTHVGLTALAAQPLNTVTLYQLLQATKNLPESDQLDLGQLDLSNTPLGSLSVGAIALGGAPLADLAGSTDVDWCATYIEPFTDTPCNDTPGVDPNAIDTETATLVSLSLEGIPLRNIPLRNIPLRNIDLGSAPLRNVPLRNIPLRNIDLAVSPLRNIPLRNIPLRNIPIVDDEGVTYDVGTVVGTPLRNIPLRNIPLRNIDVNASPLRNIPLRNIALSASPLRNIPLRNIPLRNIDVNASPLRNIPLRNIDLASSPLRNIPLRNIPLRNIPLRNIGGLAASPLRNIPLRNITLAGSPLRNIPLRNISTVAQLVDCAAVDCSASSAITLGSVTLLPTATLGLLADGLPDDTDLGILGDLQFGDDAAFILGDVADAFESLPDGAFTLEALFQLLADDLDGTYTLADIAQGILDDAIGDGSVYDLLFDVLTISDVVNILLADPARFGIAPSAAAGVTEGFQNLTIDQLIEELKALEPPVMLADLFLGVFDPGDVSWDEIDLDVASEGLRTTTNPAGVPFTVFVTSSLPATQLDFTVTLPAGFSYVPGSLQVPPGASAAGEPTITPASDGTTIVASRFSMPEINQDNGPVALQINALPPLAVGDTEPISAVVSAPDWLISASTTDGYTLVDPLEDNDTPDTASYLTDPADSLVLSYISHPSDVDWFQIQVAQGEQLSLNLSNLPDDYDMLLFAPAASTTLRGVPTRTLVPAADNGLSLLGEDAVVAQIGSDVDTSPPDGYRFMVGSARRGTDQERIDTAPLPAGRYMLKVVGYNGANAKRPYVLRTRIDGSVAGQACAAVATAGSQLSLAGVTTTIGAGTDTLVLVDTARLQRSYGTGPAASNAATVVSALGAFTSALDTAPAARFAGTKAAVIDLAGVAGVRAANAAWDQNPCDPELANDVVAAITAHLDSVLTPAIKNIVIIGADDQVPMARLRDATPAHNEQEYAETWNEANPVGASQALGYLLSDDPYASADPIAVGSRELFVPELAIGRLVESPSDIALALGNFVGSDGRLDPQTAVSTGYDFLEDGARAVADELKGALVPAANVDDSLIDTGLDAWTKADLDQAFAEGGPDVASINAHFDHYRALPADQDAAGRLSDPLTITDVTGAPDVGGERPLDGSIIFSMGCHGGLSVSDVAVGSLDADWAQAFGSQGAAAFAGNTGFGYGDTAVVAFSEELMRLFAARLSQAPTIGAAMSAAKQRYISDLAVISPFEEKVSSQVVFYGLPMYRIDGAEAPPVDAFETVTPDPLSGIPSANVGVNPVATPTPTVTGTYYKVGDEVQATPYQPIQPRVSTDVTAAGTNARGALITGLVSDDVDELVDPVVVTPTDDVTGTNAEAPSTGAIFPSVLQSVARVTDIGGERDRLVLVPGQFRGIPDDPAGRGVQRLFTDIDAKVFYAPPGNTDTTPPVIAGTHAAIIDGQVVIQVDVGSSDVSRVLAVYVESNAPDPKVWKTLELASDDGSTYVGAAPAAAGAEQIDYFIQVLDTGGNVSASSDKGSNYSAVTVPVVPPVQNAPTLNVSPAVAVGGVYSGPVTVTAVPGSDGQVVQLVIDGQPAPNPSTISGSGLYTVQAVAPGFEPVARTVAIDATVPTMSATVTPAPNVNGWYAASSAPVNVAIAKADGPEPVSSVTWAWTRTPGGTAAGATVAGPTANVALTADGIYAVSYSGSTARGRTSDTNSLTVKIDRTAPVVTASGPASVVNNVLFTVGCTATDATSGIATSDCANTQKNAALLPLGPNTFTFTVTDVAGNQTTRSVTVTVNPANTPPVVKADMGSAGLEAIGFQTSIVAVIGKFTDAEGNGPYSASVRWNAGGLFLPLVVVSGTEFLAPWIYTGTAAQTVTIRICDKAGLCGSDDISVRPNVNTKIVPVVNCVSDRGAANASTRYEARWGYKNTANVALAVPSIPILENTFNANPYWRGQPEIFLPGTKSDVFRTTFASGTQTWTVNGNSVTAKTNTTRC